MMKLHTGIRAALVLLAAATSATSTSANEPGLLLAMKISKQGQPALNPKLWSPVGSAASLSTGEGLTIEVQSSPAGPERVRLNIGIREGNHQGHASRRVDVTVPMEKEVRLQLGEDPATSWHIEFTPRLTASPGQTV